MRTYFDRSDLKTYQDFLKGNGGETMIKANVPNTKEYKVYKLLVKYSGRVLRQTKPIKQLLSECISELVELYSKI